MSWNSRYTWILIEDPGACYCCDGDGYYFGPDEHGNRVRNICGACNGKGRCLRERPQSKNKSIYLANYSE